MNIMICTVSTPDMAKLLSNDKAMILRCLLQRVPFLITTMICSIMAVYIGCQFFSFILLLLAFFLGKYFIKKRSAGV